MLRYSLIVISLIVGTTCNVSADEPPAVEAFLHAGKLADGEKALVAALEKNPQDDQTRFGLGTLQLLRAVEHLAQSFHKYGLRTDRGLRMNIPFLRLPVPENRRPDTLTYTISRNIILDLINDLQKSDSTLAAIKDDSVKLPIRLGPVRMDFEGDNRPDEQLTAVLARYMGGERNVPQVGELKIVFDRADVAWMRGYCHLLMSLAEIALAHDGQELFECTAHVFFKKVETPHTFLNKGRGTLIFDLGDEVDLVDVIAFIHLLRLPVKEPARMQSALRHLEQMLALSKESWKYVLAETDDDHEWIPNPKQQGVLGVPVRQEMIDSWLEFVDEGEQLLAGKVLVPLWRGGYDKRGVNLRRVFLEPRPLDIVLWVQGTAATPYLEEGPQTKPEVWGRLQQVFRGQFIGFAIWFN